MRIYTVIPFAFLAHGVYYKRLNLYLVQAVLSLSYLHE